jgi:transcriptional regulator with XRE-family HTH domain
MPTTLGEKLRAHRQKLGYSLDDLAGLSDSSKSYLWELENRDTRKPSAEKLTKIAEVLQVTTEYLLDEKADMDDAQIKEAFFRKFNKLEDGDKKRIEDMINAWGKKQ